MASSSVYTRILVLILITISFLLMPCVATFWTKFGTIGAATDVTCTQQNSKLLSLLNLLCNTTQTTSNQMRDACYGCFFRAGSILDGPAQLYSLNDCARLYMQQTAYSSCAVNLQAIVDGNRATASEIGLGRYCNAGYCEFVRCIRHINTQKLISSCYTEAMGTRNLAEDLDRVYFYTNVTSCILAKTRCSQYNPITGEMQHPYIGLPPVAPPPPPGNGPVITNIGVPPPPSPFFNSLQISESGDIRVLTFPTATTNINEIFCSNSLPLLQSGFGTYFC